MSSWKDLLRPQVLTQVISQQAATSSWLLNLFGMGPGGKNEVNKGHGRMGSYHIYDHVRKVAKMRAPGMPAARSSHQPMSKVPFEYPRMHDSISLLAEDVHNLGLIADPATRDVAGKDYIRRQTATLAEKAKNWRLAQLAGMLRGGWYIAHANDDDYVVFSSEGDAPALFVDAKMPAGNKTQLDMLGDGDIIDASWATASTKIPVHLAKINIAFNRLCGGHLTAVLCGAEVWMEVIDNTMVKDMHGTSNPPFKMFDLDQTSTQLGVESLNVHRGQLTVMPGVDWWISDEGLDLGAPGSEAYVPLIPANSAIFLGCNPQGDSFAMMLGSEPIAEYDNGPETIKTGLASWSVKRSNPTTTEVYELDNALAINMVPKSVALGTVIF